MGGSGTKDNRKAEMRNLLDCQTEEFGDTTEGWRSEREGGQRDNDSALQEEGLFAQRSRVSFRVQATPKKDWTKMRAAHLAEFKELVGFF